MKEMLINIGKCFEKPVCIDTRKTMNQHILFLGESGTGKTVEGQKIICEIVKQGGTVLALDMHHCLDDDEIFRTYKEAFYTSKIEIDARIEGVRCRLLEPMSFMNGTVEDEWCVINSITDVIKRVLRFGVNQEIILREALYSAKKEKLYEKEGIRCLDKILARSEEKLSMHVRERMRLLTMPNIFRPGDGFVRKGKINVLRISDFDLGTQEIVAELVLSFLWRQANALLYRDEPLYIFVDECQNLPTGKTSSLSRIISEGRKLGLHLILATQQISLGTLTVMEQRMQQSGTILYFRPDMMSAERIAKMIDREKYKRWTCILRELKCGEFIGIGALSVNGIQAEKALIISSYEE